METPNTETSSESKKQPICCIVIGMAGSGKTTLMQRMIKTAFDNDKTPYILNLDPAVSHLPYSCNIDIRDSVDYKGVMKDYKLGPNGSIMTSLNLFATRFDQVINYVENKANDIDYVFVDTPGQIEVFTWSASGEIITELLSSSLPTVLIYVVDTPRSSQPVTFMSNMLYACSIFYRLCLPILIVFNKTDIEDSDKIDRWMKDYDYFHECISSVRSDSFILPLTHSLALSLDEFYNTMNTVSISSVTGEGCIDLFQAINSSVQEYNSIYLPERKRRMEERLKKEQQEHEAQLNKYKTDMHEENDDAVEQALSTKQKEQSTGSEVVPNQDNDDLEDPSAIYKEEDYPYQMNSETYNDYDRNEDEDSDEVNEEVEEEEHEYDHMMKWIDKLKEEQKK